MSDLSVAMKFIAPSFKIKAGGLSRFVPRSIMMPDAYGLSDDGKNGKDKANGAKKESKKEAKKTWKNKARLYGGWALIAASFILPPPIPAGAVGAYLVARESEAARRVIARFRKKFPKMTNAGLKFFGKFLPKQAAELDKLTDPKTVLKPKKPVNDNKRSSVKKDGGKSTPPDGSPKMRKFRRPLREPNHTRYNFPKEHRKIDAKPLVMRHRKSRETFPMPHI